MNTMHLEAFPVYILKFNEEMYGSCGVMAVQHANHVHQMPCRFDSLLWSYAKCLPCLSSLSSP